LDVPACLTFRLNAHTDAQRRRRRRRSSRRIFNVGRVLVLNTPHARLTMSMGRASSAAARVSKIAQ